MFSDNKKISSRQVFRLFVFCFAGLSSLLLPAQLARLVGSAGWLCIVTGGCLGILYLEFLMRLLEKLDTDLLTYLRERASVPMRKLTAGFLAVYCILTAAFCLDIFADVMQENLVGSESFAVVILVILAAAGYAVSGGIESWMRVYELLFWFVFLPLALMLAVGAKTIDAVYLTQLEGPRLENIMKGSYIVFLFLELSFWVLFFPGFVSGKDRRRSSGRSVFAALAAALGLLLVICQTVLGNFGAGALEKLPYPVVTLMSTIQVSGSFIKRLDALMAGVWFFSLFALVTLLLFFGIKMVHLLFDEEPLKRSDGNSQQLKRSDGNSQQLKRFDQSREHSKDFVQSREHPKGFVQSREHPKGFVQSREHPKGFVQSSGHPKGSDRRRQHLLLSAVLLLVAALALWGKTSVGLQELFRSYILYIGAPVLVLIPVGLYLFGE